MAMVDQVIQRSMAEQHQAYTAEVRVIIDAAYAVIARSGRFDPPVRAILAEAGLSNPAFYRHFRSKDELLLVLLDEGRRQLVQYLDHQIEAAPDPDERVEAWVRGVLAQSTDESAARRTRPFVTQVERLQQRFPAEQEASEQQLLDQLRAVLGSARNRWAPTIYSLVFGELERYLRTETTPTDNDIDQLVAFVLAGADAER